MKTFETKVSGFSPLLKENRGAELNLDHIQAMLPGDTNVAAEDYEIELKSNQANFPTADVHGPAGLGGVCGEYIFDNTLTLVREDALKLFSETIESHPAGTVTLITTGPLTNLARFIEQCPETVKKLRRVIAMGEVFFKVRQPKPGR